MRTFKVYRHGFTIGTAPSKNDHEREKRGQVHGWSMSATRRNTAFLRSVYEPDLHATSDGEQLNAFAVTLTLKDCPATSDDWHRLRRSFMKRLERLGLYRCHWVTEWQRRGVPHLHGAVWFPGNVMPWDIVRAWTAVSADYGASDRGQHITPITDAVGWFKYLSKHASRGVSHYQRNPENIPPAWHKKTGRVWGKTGDWPLSEPVQLTLDDRAFYAMRRIAKRWRIADARASVPDAVRLAIRKAPSLRACPPEVQKRAAGAYRRVQSAKRMLKAPKDKSSVIGVSEWLPMDVQFLALDWLRSQGHSVTC